MPEKRQVWKLGLDHIIELVPGPLPYLWIGDSDPSGAFYDATKNTAQLRSLRDALTKALREARRG